MVRISVTDEGGGFDPDTIPDPISDENLLKDVGRGIFIVKSLMDDVIIKATDTGTTVTIAKTIG
jgi:serine/threonine-protein kinase RsbW